VTKRRDIQQHPSEASVAIGIDGRPIEQTGSNNIVERTANCIVRERSHDSA
jgi:hypothetical protein